MGTDSKRSGEITDFQLTSLLCGFTEVVGEADGATRSALWIFFMSGNLFQPRFMMVLTTNHIEREVVGYLFERAKTGLSLGLGEYIAVSEEEHRLKAQLSKPFDRAR